ncbi:uncharacterized protein LY89DRAFT_669317 [Mollisia scopiformis]|uniref:Uncharacterized protein n=1 Tax=Mollisia scopiformis TaxID=149040 RepID=A0A194X9M4_MOLSC|nr:uncharacterized protein LY89DRAFT_669317 [Mollisia scopiformis]KUJ16871.1 hypothetical protein LY89DRAFT_669317 [Mollisia scopiformis]
MSHHWCVGVWSQTSCAQSAISHSRNRRPSRECNAANITRSIKSNLKAITAPTSFAKQSINMIWSIRPKPKYHYNGYEVTQVDKNRLKREEEKATEDEKHGYRPPRSTWDRY